MGMDIDIDGSIKELSKWRKDLDYDNGDYCYGDDNTEHSLDVAIDIMMKYQKIQQIYERFKKDCGYFPRMAWLDVMKVIKDELF